MKYLVVVPSLENKGPVIVALDLAEKLSRNGHEVDGFYTLRMES